MSDKEYKYFLCKVFNLGLTIYYFTETKLLKKKQVHICKTPDKVPIDEKHYYTDENYPIYVLKDHEYIPFKLNELSFETQNGPIITINRTYSHKQKEKNILLGFKIYKDFSFITNTGFVNLPEDFNKKYDMLINEIKKITKKHYFKIDYESNTSSIDGQIDTFYISDEMYEYTKKNNLKISSKYISTLSPFDISKPIVCRDNLESDFIKKIEIYLNKHKYDMIIHFKDGNINKISKLYLDNPAFCNELLVDDENKLILYSNTNVKHGFVCMDFNGVITYNLKLQAAENYFIKNKKVYIQTIKGLYVVDLLTGNLIKNIKSMYCFTLYPLENAYVFGPYRGKMCFYDYNENLLCKLDKWMNYFQKHDYEDYLNNR